MAVPEQTPYKEYTANGSTTSFALGFICDSKNDLIVLVDGVEPPVATWSLVGNNAVFTTAPASGKKIILQRQTKFERTTNFQGANNSFRPETINKDIDRVWLKLQELGVADMLLRIYVDRLHGEQKDYIDNKDQLVRNIISDLRNYVNQQDGSLSSDINNLRTHVDQQDNNRNSYFENLISQQGVSLQQLDDYYKHLLQGIANIAANKGWLASLVVDTSGRNQQAINDLVKAQLIRTSNYELINDQAIDQSVKLQAIANIAKAGSKTLIIDSLTDAVYAVMGVDITGLTVEVSPTVSFIAPTTATNQYTFIALGTSGNLAPQTILKNAKLDAAGRMRGVFRAEYVNEPHAPDCSAINVPTGASPDGSGVSMKECIKPRVKGGFYHGGRQGVLFISCTNPEAEGVTTDYQGRDGILFYTDPTGTTTTDATATSCKATRYALNGEGGRAGIHFYGVRRAKAIAPTASGDNGQTFDDTAAVRFRDCEDYYTDGYDVSDALTGVLVNEIGDYAAAPHNIVVRGAIGVGNVKGIRKFGVSIATPNRICNIVGAVVSDSANVAGGAGIYTAANGSVTGCTVENTTNATGIYTAGKCAVTGNNLRNAGRSGTSVAQITAGGETIVSGNTFENADGSSALAIRVLGSGKSVVGANNYDAATTQQVLVDANATLKRGSALLKTQFAGVPANTGNFETGIQAIDTNNVVYARESSGWKRQTPRLIATTVGTTQTTIAHGLGYKPTEIGILVKSNANVWQSAEADAENVYLTASVAGASINVSCR